MISRKKSYAKWRILNLTKLILRKMISNLLISVVNQQSTDRYDFKSCLTLLFSNENLIFGVTEIWPQTLNQLCHRLCPLCIPCICRHSSKSWIVEKGFHLQKKYLFDLAAQKYCEEAIWYHIWIYGMERLF